MVDGNDKRRLCSVGCCQTKTGIGIRYKQTDDDDTADVEEENTDVNTLNGLRQVPTGILSFSSGNLFMTVESEEMQ